MIEQTGSVFLECEKDISIVPSISFSDIFIRNSKLDISKDKRNWFNTNTFVIAT